MLANQLAVIILCLNVQHQILVGWNFKAAYDIPMDIVHIMGPIGLANMRHKKAKLKEGAGQRTILAGWGSLYPRGQAGTWRGVQPWFTKSKHLKGQL